jgi:hypothetical protein
MFRCHFYIISFDFRYIINTFQMETLCLNNLHEVSFSGNLLDLF